MKRRGFLQTLFGAAAAPTIGTVLAKLPAAAPVVASETSVYTAQYLLGAGGVDEFSVNKEFAKDLWPGIQRYWEAEYAKTDAWTKLLDSERGGK